MWANVIPDGTVPCRSDQQKAGTEMAPSWFSLQAPAAT